MHFSTDQPLLDGFEALWHLVLFGRSFSDRQEVVDALRRHPQVWGQVDEGGAYQTLLHVTFYAH